MTFTTGEVTRRRPHEPGHYIFKGYRQVRDAMYEHLSEPLEIREEWKGKLSVRMTGRGTFFPLDKFEGEWVHLGLEEA